MIKPLEAFRAGCFDECCGVADFVEVFIMGKRQYGVECLDCGRLVGYFDTVGEAMVEWNKEMRSAPTLCEVLGVDPNALTGESSALDTKSWRQI